MSSFDALSGSGSVSRINAFDLNLDPTSGILDLGVDESAASMLTLDPSVHDIIEEGFCFNFGELNKKSPKCAKFFDDALPNFDKKDFIPCHFVRKKGEKKLDVIFPKNVAKKQPERDGIEFYKSGKKVASINIDNINIKSYTKDQLITVSRIFQKNLEEYINKLKELKKEEEKRKKTIEKERKAGYVRSPEKRQNFSKITEKSSDKQSETASKTNYISQKIMEENGRQYERIIKKRRKIDDKFHDELIEIKEKTEEIHELRKEEDIKYKIDENYGTQ